MLSEITTGKEVKKLDCLSVTKVIKKDIEVVSNDEFMRGGGCVGKKRRELVEKCREMLGIW